MIKIITIVVIAALISGVTTFGVSTASIDHEYDMANIESQYETLHEEFLMATNEIKALKDTIVFIEEQSKKQRGADAIITFYHPATGGINTDGDPTKTATGTKPRSGISIALSTSLVRKGWLGRRIYIEGYGVFTADDRMNVHLEGDRIDICAPTLKYALKKGKTPGVFCCPL